MAYKFRGPWLSTLRWAVVHRLSPLGVDQAMDGISLGEAFHEAGAMLKYSTHKIACYSNVQNAVGTIGQNVNVAACHADILQDVDGRDKPGHDELRGFL